MKSDDDQSGVAGSVSNESPTREAFLEERKRFLEDVRLRGGEDELNVTPSSRLKLQLGAEDGFQPAVTCAAIAYAQNRGDGVRIICHRGF